MPPTVVIGLICLALLAGCGGGGGVGETTNTAPDPSPDSFSNMTGDFGLITTSLSGLSASDPAALPGTGSASYDGVMRASLIIGGDNTEMTGRLDLTANFGTDQITGGVSGIIDENERPFSGDLILSDGVIDRGADTSVAYTFAADLGGTIDPGAAAIVIDGILQGDFLGAGQSGISGAVTATATDSGVTGSLIGDFTAE